MYVCREGAVPSHNIFFERKSIESTEAEESIKNKPLLCAYEVDEDGNKIDFKGHEYDYKVVKNGKTKTLKIVYEEQPIGVIPQDNNFTIEEDSEGVMWISVEAYIFNEYCDDAVRIIEENEGIKEVSMEMEIIESHDDKEDGMEHIDLFKFQGITLLGGTHKPAIDGAVITSNLTQSLKFELGYKNMLEKIRKFEEGERLLLNKEELRKKYEYLSKVEGFEEIFADEKFDIETSKKKLFELSSQFIEGLVRDNIVDLTVKRKYSWGEEYESRLWYFETLLVESNIAILRDNSDNHYYAYGVPYSISGDKLTLDFESKKRYVRGDWREAQDGETDTEVITMALEDTTKKFEDKLNSTKEELDTAKVSCSDANSKLEAIEEEKVKLEEENKLLKESNSKFEIAKKTSEVDEKLKKYEKLSALEGYKEIVSLKLEKPFEDLERDLKVLAYDNGITIKTKKEKFEDNSGDGHTHIPLDNGSGKSEGNLYGGILDRFCQIEE